MIDEFLTLLKQVLSDLKLLRQHSTFTIQARREAEAEIPEKIRRFANYFHDIVHIKGEYVSLGIKVPPYIDREMERCSDRFRHLLDDLHLDGGAFEKVRRDMAERSGNQYDHTRLLEKPNETRKSEQ